MIITRKLKKIAVFIVAGVMLINTPITSFAATISTVNVSYSGGSLSSATSPEGDVWAEITGSGSDGSIVISVNGLTNGGESTPNVLTSSTVLKVNGTNATYVQTDTVDDGSGNTIYYNTYIWGGSSSGSSSGETSEEEQARLEEERKSSHFEVIYNSGEKMESEVKGSFYYEQGAAVVKDDNAICKNSDDYAVNTYVATESCQPAAYASVSGYATEGGYSVVSATSFNIIDVENNPYCESVSWFEANENNTITGNTKTFAFSDGRTITTDKYTKAVAGLPEKTEGKVIVVGVTKGGVVFTQEDQDDDPATVTFDALLGNGVYGFIVK